MLLIDKKQKELEYLICTSSYFVEKRKNVLIYMKGIEQDEEES